MIDTTTTKGHDMTDTYTTDVKRISDSLGLDFQPYTGQQAIHTPLAYMATGPRGAQYGLVRYPKSPDYLYVINLRTWRVGVAIHGNSTFTDRDGVLATVNS